LSYGRWSVFCRRHSRLRGVFRCGVG